MSTHQLCCIGRDCQLTSLRATYSLVKCPLRPKEIIMNSENVHISQVEEAKSILSVVIS